MWSQKRHLTDQQKQQQQQQTQPYLVSQYLQQQLGAGAGAGEHHEHHVQHMSSADFMPDAAVAATGKLNPISRTEQLHQWSIYRQTLNATLSQNALAASSTAPGGKKSSSKADKRRKAEVVGEKLMDADFAAASVTPAYDTLDAAGESFDYLRFGLPRVRTPIFISTFHQSPDHKQQPQHIAYNSGHIGQQPYQHQEQHAAFSSQTSSSILTSSDSQVSSSQYNNSSNNSGGQIQNQLDLAAANQFTFGTSPSSIDASHHQQQRSSLLGAAQANDLPQHHLSQHQLQTAGDTLSLLDYQRNQQQQSGQHHYLKSIDDISTCQLQQQRQESRQHRQSKNDRSAISRSMMHLRSSVDVDNELSFDATNTASNTSSARARRNSHSLQRHQQLADAEIEANIDRQLDYACASSSSLRTRALSMAELRTTTRSSSFRSSQAHLHPANLRKIGSSAALHSGRSGQQQPEACKLRDQSDFAPMRLQKLQRASLKEHQHSSSSSHHRHHPDDADQASLQKRRNSCEARTTPSTGKASALLPPCEGGGGEDTLQGSSIVGLTTTTVSEHLSLAEAELRRATGQLLVQDMYYEYDCTSKPSLLCGGARQRVRVLDNLSFSALAGQMTLLHATNGKCVYTQKVCSYGG